ncbi:sensor histidine kinase [Actinopolymorpha pittospori]|uniref:histidine kinase n=1 Tax=Actinopolymorpha pittospori TaxID=648752 RepID=A0A927MWJ3_9ACTN|nr:sensor histidine kinase [Actinopolymorpha pittospori]MBE1606073.1 signal transduction histidine kinase [Actinopolymorpha pittospori]
MTDATTRSSRVEGVPSRRAAPVRGLVLVGTSLVAGVAALTVVAAATLIPVWVGVSLFPAAANWLRTLANRSRERAARWSGEPLRELPFWVAEEDGFTSRALLCRRIATDRTFWGEVLWAVLQPFSGAVLATVPFALVVYGVFGALVQPFLWARIHAFADGNYYAMIHVDSWTNAILAIPLGVVFVALGFWSGPWWLRLHAKLIRRQLTTAHADLARQRAELARRVEQLDGIRTEVTDASAADLRRIERDLHDGAQARLVAMGMSLDAAERQLAHDPESARALLVQARHASSAALQELRDLVRGIHPPVLADRGLPDAVRALALEMVQDVTVDAALPARLPTPVEAAAYFAVNEVMTNAAKHASATRVAVDLGYDGGRLRIEITDDGNGGADPARGTGLRGITRRLAAFDGTLAVDSPHGGPTTVRMEVPCALSSPRTSSS